ncbi:MAG TPA: hypothetical protein VJ438_05690 [Candidatus Nanoarchaeia archaeon]|nr:hypothetical protein [Candidatus Nanoarchaeia archaeon]
MVKNLISKIEGGIKRAGKGLKKAVLVGAAAASIGGFAACQLPVPTPVNYPPIAEVYATPDSGTYPLSSDLSVNGTDLDGDITEYSMDIDYDKDGHIDETIPPQATPITNVPRTFNEDAIVWGQVKDSKGHIDRRSVVIDGSAPNDYVDISGRLEDCENDGTGRAGVIEVYDARTQNPDGSYNYSNLLEETSTANGDFSFTLDKLVNSDSEDKIYVRAFTGTSANPTSYKRTIELSANTDHNPIADPRANPAIRPTPFYSDFDGDGYADIDKNKNHVIEQSEKEDFKEDITRVNFSDNVSINPAPEPGSKYLKKLSFNRGLPEDFQGIEISSDDFTGEEYDAFKKIIVDSGYLKAGQIHFEYGNIHINETGWGRVIDANGSEPHTEIWDSDQNGYIDKFTTHLNKNYEIPGHIDAGIANHEISGHGHLFPGHPDSASTPALFNSVMKYTSYDERYSPPERPNKFTPIDIKRNYIIDEDTNLGKDTLDDILGLD